MARPRPVPPLALVLELSTWWNCSKIRSCWSSGIPGPVSVTETAKRPLRAPAAMLTSPASVNLMALPTRLSSTWVRRCSSPRPTGSDLSTEVVSVSFLFCASDSVAARTVSTTFSMAYSVMLRVKLAGLDLGDVEHGIDEAQQVLAVGADAGEGIERFLSLWLVEAFLDEFGISENGCERGSKLVAHVGHELVLVLAGDLQILDGFGKLAGSRLHLFEKVRVFNRDYGLVRKGID